MGDLINLRFVNNVKIKIVTFVHKRLKNKYVIFVNNSIVLMN